MEHLYCQYPILQKKANKPYLDLSANLFDKIAKIEIYFPPCIFLSL